MSEANNEVENVMTAEQLVQLEQAKADKAKAEVDLAQANADTQRSANEQRADQLKAAFAVAIDESKIRFNSNFDDTLKVVKVDYDVVVDGSGKVVAIDRETGNSMPLVEAVKHTALARPYMADRRSLRGLIEREKDEKKVIESRSELKTVEEKNAYINQNGLDAWVALPPNPVPTVNLATLTFEEYLKLPIIQKVKLTDAHAENFAMTLPREGDLNSTLRRGGMRVNKLPKPPKFK